MRCGSSWRRRGEGGLPQPVGEFLRGEGVCETSYGDTRGKYQDKKGLTLPIVKQS